MGGFTEREIAEMQKRCERGTPQDVASSMAEFSEAAAQYLDETVKLYASMMSLFRSKGDHETASLIFQQSNKVAAAARELRRPTKTKEHL